MAEIARPKSLLGKAVWLFKHRPGAVWSTGRGYFLFYKAALARKLGLARLGRITLADNVRLQNNGCVMAEAPDARIFVGADSVVYENASIGAYSKGRIEIGEGSILGDIKIISKYGIRIGKRFLSSWNVFIQDFDPHPIDPALRRKQVMDMANQMRPWMSREGRAPLPRQLEPQEWNFPGDEIVIGDDVWVGAGCTILKGAKIGNGCVVAAGSVVPRGEYPAFSVIGGSPARVIKEAIGKSPVPAEN